MQPDTGYNLKDAFIKIVLILLMPAILMGLSSVVFSSFGITGVDESFTFMVSQVVTYIVLLSLNKRFQCYIKDMLHFKINIRSTIYIAIGFVLFALFTLILLNNGIGSNESQRENLNLDSLNQVYNFQTIFVTVAICLIIPFYEELLFRGILFTTILNRFGVVWSLLISSVIFGFLHSDLFFLTTIFGLIFNLLFYKTKSLIPGILLHMIWNSINVLI